MIRSGRRRSRLAHAARRAPGRKARHPVPRGEAGAGRAGDRRPAAWHACRGRLHARPDGRRRSSANLNCPSARRRAGAARGPRRLRRDSQRGKTTTSARFAGEQCAIRIDVLLDDLHTQRCRTSRRSQSSALLPTPARGGSRRRRGEQQLPRRAGARGGRVRGAVLLQNGTSPSAAPRDALAIPPTGLLTKHARSRLSRRDRRGRHADQVAARSEADGV